MALKATVGTFFLHKSVGMFQIQYVKPVRRSKMAAKAQFYAQKLLKVTLKLIKNTKIYVQIIKFLDNGFTKKISSIVRVLTCIKFQMAHVLRSKNCQQNMILGTKMG